MANAVQSVQFLLNHEIWRANGASQGHATQKSRKSEKSFLEERNLDALTWHGNAVKMTIHL